MAINLSKGDKIDLTKESISLKNIGIGLGWDMNEGGSNYDFDLDASAFMLISNGRIPNDNYFVFYNNLISDDGSIVHQGDNRVGDGDGDDESMFIDLEKINPGIEEIVFVVTIDEAKERKQNFGQVSNAFIRIYDLDTNINIAQYDLEEDFSTEISLEFGRLYKQNNQWKFKAIGMGFNFELQGFVDKFVD